MILLRVEEMCRLHEKLCAASGGSAGLRDRGLLESAVLSVEAAFGGIELYPTLAEKAARLAYGLISNHPFVDGNKRIGVLAMLVMLRLNGMELAYSQQELTDFGLDAAAGKLEYEDILGWIRAHRASFE